MRGPHYTTFDFEESAGAKGPSTKTFPSSLSRGKEEF